MLTISNLFTYKGQFHYISIEDDNKLYSNDTLAEVLFPFLVIIRFGTCLDFFLFWWVWGLRNEPKASRVCTFFHQNNNLQAATYSILHASEMQTRFPCCMYGCKCDLHAPKFHIGWYTNYVLKDCHIKLGTTCCGCRKYVGGGWSKLLNLFIYPSYMNRGFLKLENIFAKSIWAKWFILGNLYAFIVITNR